VKVVARVYTDSNGLTVAMRNGLLAYFGDATRPHAKWLSLARVLADPGSAGASYVDVRVAEHPAAGFPSGAPPIKPRGGRQRRGSGRPFLGRRLGSDDLSPRRTSRGPQGSESASSPQEGASAATSEPRSPSGRSKEALERRGSGRRAESEERPLAARAPRRKNP